MKKSIQLSIPVEELEESVDESTDWRNIIFLPFHHVWETLLSISVLVNAMCSTFDIFYKPPERKFLIVAYYFGEIMYFADFFLTIMHRKMLKVRRKRHYHRRQLGYILIDAVTLLPLFEVNSFLSMSTWKHRAVEATDYLKLKCLIRLYRIAFQISRKTVQVGLNQLANYSIGHAITIFVLGHIMGAALYYFMFLNAENWTLNLGYHKFDKKNVYHWLTICFYTMTSMVMHNLNGVIIPIAMIEKLLFAFAMLFGFYLHMMFFFGALILTFKKNFRGYFEYETLVAKIMNLLYQWDVEDELKAKTLDFLTVFWQKRSGIRSMPKMFQLLPMSLRKEVSLDIFWEALRHSHIFIGTDMSFKRSVSLVMKSEFLLPGDFLIRTGESKNKMIYIVSGIIQVLSEEDDDSPIMSFSSGTLLSETACLMSNGSGSNLRSATYCEIQTLALIDLAAVLQNFPTVARYIRQQLSNRLSTAKYQVKKRNLIEQPSDSDTIIKTLKRRWHEIWHMSHKGISPSTANLRREGRTLPFHVDNLNLLVLSDKVELRVKSICLSGECPYVMDPDSSFRKFCDFIILGAVLLQCIIIPQATFFNRQLTKSEESLCFLLDVIYYLDIYIQLSTAIKKKDRLITVPREIVVIRLKQFTFLLDFFASFPFDLIALITSCDPQVIAFYKLLKLLKIYKIFNTIIQLEMSIVINTFAMRIIKHFVLFSLVIYWITCALYGLSCGNESCDPTSWYIYNNQIYNLSKSSFYKYRVSESLFFTMSMFTNYGGTNFEVYNILDIVLVLITKIIGYLLFSYGFCELAATTILKHQAERTNRMYLWTLKREATQFKIETSVHNSVLSFLNFHLSVREGCQIFGEDNIFIDAPIELKDEIVRHRIINCLKKVRLFSDSNDDLLRYICAHSELKLVPPNSTLIKVQNKSDLLYVVMQGYCKMVSYLPGDYERKSTAVLKSGNTFPFLETFHGAFSFITVKSITVVELLLIQTKTIINALQTYEGDFSCFRDALAEHREVYGSILFRKDAKLSMIRTVEKAIDHGDMFIYNVYDVDNIKFDEEAYRQPFLNIGSFSFIRFFLMRKTINAKGWFFTVWETFRCTIAIVQMVVAIATPNIMAHYEERIEMIFIHYGFCIVWLTDLYIRMHCQYYNVIGIIVTHPYSTAKHYISTSFIIDFIANVPINIFKLDMLLGKQYQVWCNTLMLMLTRFLQLHRPFNGLSYLEEKYKGRTALLVNRFKFFMVTVIAIGMMQVFVQLCSCNAGREKYGCIPNHGYSQFNETSLEYFVSTYYKVSTFFTLSTNGSFMLDSYSVILSLFVMFPLLILRWTFLIKIISRGIGGNVELATYRHRMENYRSFVKGAYVSDKIIQDIADHHEYVWRKSQGMNMFHVMKYFHPQLEQDMAYSLYSTCLEKAVLFRDEHASLFQAISPLFHREYYTKEAKIIQCNDIQSKIYFVLEGVVSISIANTKMCAMGKGGMFGCLSKAGVTRQTMTASTTVLSTLLSVDSKLFHKTVASFPNVVKRMRRINSLNFEYLEAYSNALVEAPTDAVLYSGTYEKYKSFYDKILINGDSRWCRALEFLINVHIAPMSAIFVLAVTFTHLHTEHHDYVKALIYTLDTICFIKLYLKFHIIYVDAESGHMVKDPYAIRMRYARTTFWFDLLAIIPLELMVTCFTNNRTIHNVCVLNRVLRFAWLVLYYKQASVKVSINKQLNWTYQIYLNLFQIQIMICLWLLAACHHIEGARCSYDSSRTLVKTSIVSSNNSFDSSVLAGIFILNVLSCTGLRIVKPLYTFEYAMTVIISLIAQYVVLDLFSGSASLYMVENHVFELYEMKFKRLWTYLQGRNLSSFLSTKVWNYCAHLWGWQRGHWMPKLIEDAPNYLKEDMLLALYGRYLVNHFLFANTHIDFLRQLVICFDRCVFLPEDSIVEKGDTDCCMYFVNKGDVNVFDVQGKLETKIDCLTVGRSFGEAQGMLCIPHKFTYRASSITELLILDRNKWSYLLKWFPASNQEIIARAAEYSLADERSETEL